MSGLVTPALFAFCEIGLVGNLPSFLTFSFDFAGTLTSEFDFEYRAVYGRQY